MEAEIPCGCLCWPCHQLLLYSHVSPGVAKAARKALLPPAALCLLSVPVSLLSLSWGDEALLLLSLDAAQGIPNPKNAFSLSVFCWQGHEHGLLACFIYSSQWRHCYKHQVSGDGADTARVLQGAQGQAASMEKWGKAHFSVSVYI